MLYKERYKRNQKDEAEEIFKGLIDVNRRMK